MLFLLLNEYNRIRTIVVVWLWLQIIIKFIIKCWCCFKTLCSSFFLVWSFCCRCLYIIIYWIVCLSCCFFRISSCWLLYIELLWWILILLGLLLYWRWLCCFYLLLLSLNNCWRPTKVMLINKLFFWTSTLINNCMRSTAISYNL